MCETRNYGQPLPKREFACDCGHAADRDLNAAVNLARWGEDNHVYHRTPDPRAGGRVTNARRREGADRRPNSVGEPARMTREPMFALRQQPERTTPEKGGAERHSLLAIRHALS